MARASLPAKLLPPHRVGSSQGEAQEPSPGQLGTGVAAPPCPPSTGRPGADTGQHPALYLCPVCAQTRSFSQKGPRGPVKTGLHPLPSGLRFHPELGGWCHLGHSAWNHTGQCNQRGRRGARGRPEDLQWVKPHCPHPGACHLPQAGIAVESHLSRAAPQSLWKGGRGPSGVRRQVRRAPERLGK